MKEQAAKKAEQLTDQLRETAAHAAQLVKDRAPGPVLDKAAQAAAQVRETTARAGHLASEKAPGPLVDQAGRAAAAARANRTALLTFGAVVVVFALIRRSRDRRH
ncbi:hypothetical protein ABTX85_10555 [Streptomyces sp. NPDC096097]|uniref:hypothetical protein n=1 Tax=Streptomyces sp. NPDC096097 TaxID=3155546 RepID=UPI00331A7CE4